MLYANSTHPIIQINNIYAQLLLKRIIKDVFSKARLSHRFIEELVNVNF